jgi:hypothetical protein
MMSSGGEPHTFSSADIRPLQRRSSRIRVTCTLAGRNIGNTPLLEKAAASGRLHRESEPNVTDASDGQEEKCGSLQSIREDPEDARL